MVTSQIAVSLDGYSAGPNQSLENPLGEGGERLHEWMFAVKPGEQSPDGEIVAHFMDGVGAFVMGRKMFGGGDGGWDASWRGWWGEDPPYHRPVFVLTHHEREPLEMDGGTTFHFVTDGIESALGRARAAAGDADVSIAGGASTVQQYLRAKAIDELHLHIAPIVLGGGERLLDDVGAPAFEPVRVVAAPACTHVRYRVTY